MVNEDTAFRSVSRKPADMVEERVDMCEAIEEIRKDAKAEGIEEGILKTLIALVKDGVLTIADAAKRANMTVSEVEDKTGLKA